LTNSSKTTSLQKIYTWYDVRHPFGILADAGVKVRYDVRGQGLSDQPLDPSAWTSNKFAEDFKAVVEAYGLKKPFIAPWCGGFHSDLRVPHTDDPP